MAVDDNDKSALEPSPADLLYAAFDADPCRAVMAAHCEAMRVSESVTRTVINNGIGVQDSLCALHGTTQGLFIRHGLRTHARRHLTASRMSGSLTLHMPPLSSFRPSARTLTGITSTSVRSAKTFSQPIRTDRSLAAFSLPTPTRSRPAMTGHVTKWPGHAAAMPRPSSVEKGACGARPSGGRW